MGHFPDSTDDAPGTPDTPVAPGTPDSPPPLPLGTPQPRAAYAPEPYAPQPPVKADGVPMWVLVVVSLVTGLICLMIGAGVGFVMGVAVTTFEEIGDFTYADDVALTIEAPDTVKTGEAFAVVVTLNNEGDTTRTINTIDFYDSYLAGVTLESASPAWTESTHEDDYTQFTFPQTIQPGASLTIKLNFVAGDKPGVYADDLEVWFSGEVDYVYETLETTVE